MKIYKYIIPLCERIKINMPLNALIRHIGLQNEQICIWAEIDEKNKISKKNFYIVGTGCDIPKEAKYYIGTIQQPPYVWHIYE